MDSEVQRELERLGVDLTRGSTSSDVFEQQKRPSAVYTAKNERFVLTESGFERQFAQTYFCRYHELRPHLEETVKKSWPNMRMSRILGIKEKGSVDVVICGILFKSMKLKPQVLDKYLSKRVVEKELQINKNRVREDDALFLEDDGTRTELTGSALPVNSLVSGMCIAVKGRQRKDGKFEVQDLCYPGYAPQPPFPLRRKSQDAYVAFVSGLNLATIGPQNRLALDLLSQYLTGKLGNAEDIPQNIAHVVVCGGLIGKNEDLATAPPNSRQQLRALEPVTEVDDFLNELVQSIPVDVMPGLHDPATFLMPQQPLHKCPSDDSVDRIHSLLSKGVCFLMLGNAISSIVRPIRTVSNWMECISWEPLDRTWTTFSCRRSLNKDLIVYCSALCSRHSDLSNGIEVLKQCLKYRHVAPTCPDTLTCFPFNQSDPFVLEETPHVFFVGNQPAFQTELLTGSDIKCRLVCIPDFSIKSEAVIINLRTLESDTVCLDASLMNVCD